MMPKLLLVALALQAASTPPTADQRVSPDLIGRADALTLVQGSLSACAKRNETVVAYVTDADGFLRAALSSDGMNPVGFRTAALKTAAVLAFRASTRDLQARLATDKTFADRYGKDPRFFYHPGALPIYRGGRFVGVLALGGGHDKDEACALDALKLVPWASTRP